MLVDCQVLSPTARHSTSSCENRALCSAVSVGRLRVSVLSPGWVPRPRVIWGWPVHDRASPGMTTTEGERESLRKTVLYSFCCYLAPPDHAPPLLRKKKDRWQSMSLRDARNDKCLRKKNIPATPRYQNDGNKPIHFLCHHTYLVPQWLGWLLLSDLRFSREIEVALCTKKLLQSLVLEHELRTIHLQVLPEELHLSICYLLLYSPKSLTQDVAMTPQTCRTQLSRRLLKLEDWPTLCWSQVLSRFPQPHVLESNQATTPEWLSLSRKTVNNQQAFIFQRQFHITGRTVVQDMYLWNHCRPFKLLWANDRKRGAAMSSWKSFWESPIHLQRLVLCPVPGLTICVIKQSCTHFLG